MSVFGDNEATQCPNELAEMESGTYSYIDERTVRRLLSSEPAPIQHNSHLPLGCTALQILEHIMRLWRIVSTCEPRTPTVNADTTAHYETMENCVLSYTESCDSNTGNIDLSSHCEFEITKFDTASEGIVVV